MTTSSGWCKNYRQKCLVKKSKLVWRKTHPSTNIRPLPSKVATIKIADTKQNAHFLSCICEHNLFIYRRRIAFLGVPLYYSILTAENYTGVFVILLPYWFSLSLICQFFSSIISDDLFYKISSKTFPSNYSPLQQITLLISPSESDKYSLFEMHFCEWVLQLPFTRFLLDDQVLGCFVFKFFYPLAFRNPNTFSTLSRPHQNLLHPPLELVSTRI